MYFPLGNQENVMKNKHQTLTTAPSKKENESEDLP